jgi:hypothetical protein
VYCALIVLTFACIFALFASIGGAENDPTVLLAIAAGVAGAGAHLWLSLSIRCPACHRRVGWLVLTGMHPAQWLVQLWRGERCPSCGDTGTAPGALGRPEPPRG